MSLALKAGTVKFSVDGTGNAVAETGILSLIKKNMRVRRILVRQEAAGGATFADIYIVHNNREGVTAPATEPEENVPVQILAAPMTASAFASSLDTVITAEPVCQDSMNIVFDVTAVGAWTLLGFVEYET